MGRRGSEPDTTRVDCGEVSLEVYDYGNPSAPPLVLVHGIQDFALSLDPLAQRLRRDYRVLSYDLRGHGDSDKPGTYTFSHLLADLHAVVLECGLEGAILVGHSLGGQIVTHYAGIFPEIPSRVVSVEGLGPPFRDLDMPAELRRRRSRSGIESLLRPPRERRPIASLEDAARILRGTHPRLGATEARRLAALATERHPEGGLRWKWDPRVQTTWLSGGHHVSAERWSWIECPVLVVTGGLAHEFWHRARGLPPEAARLDPDELRRRLALFRDVRHVEIAEAGHMVHYDAPEALVGAIRDFLD